ncbi:hypothetical protein ACR9E3_29690 [Actinomycetospora sp. C-140]
MGNVPGAGAGNDTGEPEGPQGPGWRTWVFRATVFAGAVAEIVTAYMAVRYGGA